MDKMVERAIVGDGVQTWSSSSWRLTSDSEAQAGWMSGQSHMHSTHRACHFEEPSGQSPDRLSGHRADGHLCPAFTLVRISDWRQSDMHQHLVPK